MDLIQSEELNPIMQVLQQEADVTADEAKEIFTTLFVFIHGYASMFANNEIVYDEKILAMSLTKVFYGAIYVVSMVVGENVSGAIGIKKIITTPICLILALTIYLWVNKNGLKEKYGLCKFKASVTKYLFFIPLVFIASVNLWNGLQIYLPEGKSQQLCYNYVMLQPLVFFSQLFYTKEKVFGHVSSHMVFLTA